MLERKRQLHTRKEFEIEDPHIEKQIDISVTCPKCNQESHHNIKLNHDTFIDDDYNLNDKIYVSCEEETENGDICEEEIALKVDGDQWMEFAVKLLTFNDGPVITEKSKLIYSAEITTDFILNITHEQPHSVLYSKCPNCNKGVLRENRMNEFYKTWDEVPTDIKKAFMKTARKSFQEWHRLRECLKVAKAD